MALGLESAQALPPTTEAIEGVGSGGWTRERRALSLAEALGREARLATARAESRGPGQDFISFFILFSGFCVNFSILEKIEWRET